MKRLLIFALIGFAAQLVDGSLGMAYGATSSSLLLMFGVAPAVASGSIHMAEIATTAASGASHLYYKNVDKTILMRLTIPGAISAFIGAAFLSSIPGDMIKPFVSGFLLVLGVYILLRFMLVRQASKPGKKISSKFLLPLGLAGGFFDAVGGGGWGPITTPMLLARKMEPRKVIGTVDASEFAIAVSATLGFVLFMGWDQFHWPWVFAFMISGVLAAPIAAYLVRIIPAYMLGVLVGGFIILTNLRTMLQSIGVEDGQLLALIYAVTITLWIAVIVWQVVNRKKFVEAVSVEH
ncbi:sulfite exporter TauE/SafE family protein [Paenibacillus turpanensis]|uniref:sulfite exporter TauE/SafE family protein n=1 Tax=Paenibacillus turpanensis TaxID=2689078 RepID=UPI0014099A26|nr:sulfite exporter TauE/SafE family protein [Paenibacillus turpanensis]